MATVKEVFRKGIADGNWQSICKVYEIITGEQAPEPPSTNILGMEIEIPEAPPSVLEIEVEEEEKEAPLDAVNFTIKHKGKEAGAKNKRQAKWVPFRKRQRTNSFNDDGTLHDDELVTKDPRLGVANPRPRNKRKELGMVDTSATIRVQCSLCGLEEEIQPSLAFGYSKNVEENTYKCTSCSTPSGRKKIRNESE